MIIYYKSCGICYKLLPNPLVRRDTEKNQRFINNHMSVEVPAGDMTLKVNHRECTI